MIRTMALVLALGITAGVSAQQGPQPASAEAELLRAEARYREAIRLNPEIAAYHTSLGLVLQRSDRDAEALAAFREAVRLEPESARAHATLAGFLMQRGDWRGAEESLELAVQLDRLNPQFRVDYGRTLLQQEKWREAERELEHAVALHPGDRRMRTLLEQARSEAGIPLDAPVERPTADPGTSNLVQRVFTIVFGGMMLIAGLVLIVPVLGTLYLVLIAAPLAAMRRRTQPA